MKCAVFLFAILTVFFLSCSSSVNSTNEFSVKYEITGSAALVNITIENSTGGTSQYSDIKLPWSHNFPSKKPAGTFVYVSAQNQGQTGTIRVRIYKDGEVFKESTSSGAYVIATASGSL